MKIRGMNDNFGGGIKCRHFLNTNNISLPENHYGELGIDDQILRQGIQKGKQGSSHCQCAVRKTDLWEKKPNQNQTDQ